MTTASALKQSRSMKGAIAMASYAACVRFIAWTGSRVLEIFLVESNNMPVVLIQEKQRHTEENDKYHYRYIVNVHGSLVCQTIWSNDSTPKMCCHTDVSAWMWNCQGQMKALFRKAGFLPAGRTILPTLPRSLAGEITSRNAQPSVLFLWIFERGCLHSGAPILVKARFRAHGVGPFLRLHHNLLAE